MGGSPNRIATFQPAMELRVGLEPTTCALLVPNIRLALILPNVKDGGLLTELI